MYIVLLALFRSTTEENDDLLAVFGEIDAITGTVIDSMFVNATADALRAREILQSDTIESRCHLPGGFCIQPIEPFAKRAAAALVSIFAQLEHPPNGSIYCTMVTTAP